MLRRRSSPARSQRKVVRKDQLPCPRSLYIWVVCLKILLRESLFYGKEGKLGSNHTVKFSKGTWHHIKFGKERVHREASFKSVNFTSGIRARSDLSTGTLHQERCARRVANNVYKLKNTDKATFYSPFKNKATPAPISKSPEEREFVVDSGACVHMLSKKGFKLREMETLRRSRNPQWW